MKATFYKPIDGSYWMNETCPVNQYAQIAGGFTPCYNIRPAGVHKVEMNCRSKVYRSELANNSIRKMSMYCICILQRLDLAL